MSDQQPSHNADNDKRFAITWPLAIGIVFGSIIACCGGGMLLVQTGVIEPFPSTGISDQDYDTNAEKLNAVNSVLPITLPASTRVKSFTIEGFQDLYILFEGRIPQADHQSFVGSLSALDQPTPDTYKGQIGADYIEIRIDPVTGDVWIECINN